MIMKKITLLMLLALMFSSVANAELIPVIKDFHSSNFQYKTENQVSTFENNDMKISVNGFEYRMYPHFEKAIDTYYRMLDTQKQIYRHDSLATTGTGYRIAECVGTNLSIENKTNEPLYIDLNSSVITICGYYGKPLIEGIKFSESSTANMPPLIVMPKQKIEKILYRNDFEFMKPSILYEGGWQVRKQDFYLDKNILGNFLFVVGLNEKKMIPMNFNIEVDSNSVKPYIDIKKVESIEKFKGKMIKKLSEKK